MPHDPKDGDPVCVELFPLEAIVDIFKLLVVRGQLLAVCVLDLPPKVDSSKGRQGRKAQVVDVADVDLAGRFDAHVNGLGLLRACGTKEQIDPRDVGVRCGSQREGDLLGKAVAGAAVDHRDAM